jgi:DNA polymerase III subunit epsilon
MEELFNLDQPLIETEFVLFDVETTGLSPAYGHRVCEVACLRVRGGEQVGRFEALVDPGRRISPGAYHVNQITAEMLAGAPRFATVARQVLALMDGGVLVAHNAPFDLGFLAMELELARVPPPEGPVVDTLTLCRRVYRFASNSLPAVARTLAVDTGPGHRAMGDAWTTWGVLEAILCELGRRWQVRTLRELLNFQGGSIPYPAPQALALPPALAEALACAGEVRMRYVDANGNETDRVVHPLRVQEQHGTLYLTAHCYRAGALRTFRLDRVIELVVAEAGG